VFFKYGQLVEAIFDRALPTVSREHRQTHAEARGSIFADSKTSEYACGIPTLLSGDSLRQHRPPASTAAPSTCRSAVCVASRPFNFPRLGPALDVSQHSRAAIPSS